MKKQALIYGIPSALGLMVLILDGKTALSSGQDGITLCLKSVIPSLFPFIFLTALMMDTLYGTDFQILQILGHIWNLPDKTEGLLIPAFLGGYPVGARCISQACTEGRLEPGDARRIMGYCNNAGPAFLFGILTSFFEKKQTIWALWGIQILGAFTVSMLLPASDGIGKKAIPKRIHPAKILNDSVEAMLKICGWVILFRILVGFLDRWFLWCVPAWLRAALIGMLELSNGCCSLDSIAAPEVRFIVCCGMLSFGGLCVFLQVNSVAENISLGTFFRGKLIQTAVCTILGAAYVFRIWPIFLCWTGWIVLLSRNRQKSSSIPVYAAV